MKGSWRSILVFLGVVSIIYYVKTFLLLFYAILASAVVHGASVESFDVGGSNFWPVTALQQSSWTLFAVIISLLIIERGITYALEEYGKKGDHHRLNFKITSFIVSVISLCLLTFFFGGSVLMTIAVGLLFLVLVIDRIMLHLKTIKHKEEKHRFLTNLVLIILIILGLLFVLDLVFSKLIYFRF